MPARTFCNWLMTIHWNHGPPTTHQHIGARLDHALEDAQSEMDDIAFATAKATTGDVHPTKIEVLVEDLHTEEIS